MTFTKLPERIIRLDELANNLWWSWHEPARKLFRVLDRSLWRLSGHNPIQQLNEISPDRLQEAATDADFLALYDSVMTIFDADMSNSTHWFATNHPDWQHDPVAYFSMEFAVHNSLPIYAGGLGILAGDVCKEASDLGLPLVAVGFMYPQGYFHQQFCLDPNSCQVEIYQDLNFDEAPISQVLSPDGQPALTKVQLGDVAIAVGVWQVRVGRTNIYLLDTDLVENPEQYRGLSARLYVADEDLRLQQEIILGIAGVRILRTLGINPSVWHANEGHAAFMMIERTLEEMTKGASFAEAMNRVRATTVFTTHTPVSAGHDVFPVELVEKYLKGYWESMSIDRETFLQLGGRADSGASTFDMTALALRMANQRCAVSQLHEKVTQRMWHVLWPQIPEEQVPISHITNGIHVPTWVAPELRSLYERYLNREWIEEHDDIRLWERASDIPDSELWAVRQQLKRKMVRAIRERMRSRWLKDNVPWKQILALGVLLDPELLTIGFVRRFTEYKRPTLVFRDIERLKRLLNNELYPVQIIFAGKSHPADFPSKQLLHQVYTLATDRDLQGRIAFVEDYDMHMAHYLVQGVDVWLNTPRTLREACGTSGMKAALNGVLNLSVPDGWWYEGFNGSNGWVLGDNIDTSKPSDEDGVDAGAFYRILEEEIVPLYYSRDLNGVPKGWIHCVKESIRSIIPAFCARRMLKEYTDRMYKPASRSLIGTEPR
jgi:starch phosphorylase